MILALDLFCGAGGATKGLQRAGFHVTGVDIKSQSRYCGDVFVQADALEPPFDLRSFDFVWASPPCQRFTDGAAAKMAKGCIYQDLIEPTHRLLANHHNTVIENIMKAPIRPDLLLHGHMFGLRVIRRRKFELSFGGLNLTPSLPKGLLREGFTCVVGHGTQSGVREMGLPGYTISQQRSAMGIEWMTQAELSQAIPPVYSEFIASLFLAQLREAAE
jgi:DNA (cytosine-5)-methyltransferase 1